MKPENVLRGSNQKLWPKNLFSLNLTNFHKISVLLAKSLVKIFHLFQRALFDLKILQFRLDFLTCSFNFTRNFLVRVVMLSSYVNE